LFHYQSIEIETGKKTLVNTVKTIIFLQFTNININ